MPITISQGLRRAAVLKGELKKLEQRGTDSVTYKADEKPAFDFQGVFVDQGEIRQELIKLKTALTLTNAQTTITWEGKPVSLVEAVIQLGELKSTIKWLETLPVKTQAATSNASYDYDDEGKRSRVVTVWTCDLPEAKRADKVSQFQKLFQKLNDLVENANHKTTLLGYEPSSTKLEGEG